MTQIERKVCCYKAKGGYASDRKFSDYGGSMQRKKFSVNSAYFCDKI